MFKYFLIIIYTIIMSVNDKWHCLRCNDIKMKFFDDINGMT